MTRKTINITGIIIITLCTLYFINKDLILSNTLELESNFNKKDPMFSVLFPEHRLIKNNLGFEMNESPIYFDLRSPIKFDRANISINYKNPSDTSINLSIKTNEGDWNFHDYLLNDKNDKSNDFIEKTIILDLANAKIENGNLKFMISMPKISQTQEKPVIKSIKAKLYTTRQRNIKDAYFELFSSMFENIKDPILKIIKKIK